MFMLLQGVVYFVLVLLIEFGIITKALNIFRGREPAAVGSQVDVRGQQDDNDVAEEKRRLNETPIDQLMQTDSLILKVS